MPEMSEISLPSRLESVDEAALLAGEFAGTHGFGDESLFAVDLAVRESVANAVKHGNKLDESKDVELRFAETDDGLEITIRDHGEGFAVDEIPDPTNPQNLMKPDGRGILFMKSFMDEVEWGNHPDGGMVVRMVKNRQKPDA